MSFVLRRTEEINVEDLTGQLADDPRQTARLILAGAREGNLEAQALLGQILLDGHGIEQDIGLALTWFGIAAERGHAMARNMLGRCLEHGWGCAKDETAAAGHYAIAAQQKLDWAMYNLANLLSTGRGVARDDARALSLYEGKRPSIGPCQVDEPGGALPRGRSGGAPRPWRGSPVVPSVGRGR